MCANLNEDQILLCTTNLNSLYITTAAGMRMNTTDVIASTPTIKLMEGLTIAWTMRAMTPFSIQTASAMILKISSIQGEFSDSTLQELLLR